MKKGTLSTLISITLAVIALIILHQTLYAQVIKPMLFSETKSLSYQNFVLLTDNVDQIVYSSQEISVKNMNLEIEGGELGGYKIIGFDYDNEELEACMPFDRNPTFQKPEKCTGNGCLCLFKDEGEDDDKLIECKIFGQTRFYSVLDDNVKRSGSIGCRKNGPTISVTSSTGQSLSFEYEDLILFGRHYYTNPLRTVARFFPPVFLIRFYNVAGDNIALGRVNWGRQEIYIENRKEGDTNHVLISIINDELKLRNKLLGECPENSESGCANLHYDRVIVEQVDGEQQSFTCKFDNIKNKCVKKEINDCEYRKISRECACGDIAYDSGYCLNNVYEPYTLPSLSEYCFTAVEYGIAECKDYFNKNFDNSQNEYACAFDLCQLEQNCVPLDTTRNGEFNKCGPCPESCTCNDYVRDYLKELNPCNCDC